MPLTLTNCLIILFGLIATWSVLYSILNEKSSIPLGLKLATLVLVLSPFIAKFSYMSYESISRQMFLMKANGEVQLAYSPLRVPDAKNSNYCDQFKNSKGQPINDYTIMEGGSYCGAIMGVYKDPLFIPYKRLDKNKAIYWVSHDLQIIGPLPDLERPLKQFVDNASDKLNKIDAHEGSVTN
jgi:hypothetical protein